MHHLNRTCGGTSGLALLILTAKPWHSRQLLEACLTDEHWPIQKKSRAMNQNQLTSLETPRETIQNSLLNENNVQSRFYSLRDDFHKCSKTQFKFCTNDERKFAATRWFKFIPQVEIGLGDDSESARVRWFHRETKAEETVCFQGNGHASCLYANSARELVVHKVSIFSRQANPSHVITVGYNDREMIKFSNYY